MRSDESQFYAILGRALADPDYRLRLVDPNLREGALRDAGVEPSAKVLEALADAIKSLDALSESFGDVRIAS
jgi:hypothetical protein